MTKYSNYSTMTEFILVGFMEHSELRTFLFFIFLLVYAVTVLGNLSIITLAILDSHLHTPMYFFLANLSFVDFGSSSTIAPTLLMTFIADSGISLIGCAAQLFFFCTFISAEACLLAIMAYDRLTAISNPLLYLAVMSKKFCVALVLGAYLCAFLNSAAQISFIFRLSFCSSKIINHFFCDVPPIMELSCSTTEVANAVHFILSTVIILITFLIILISYIYIIFSILRIHSAQGRHKAFSTCASHLTAVTIFYGTVIFMYMRPNSNIPTDQDKSISVFYTLIIPMLNPLIYSLRNKEVKNAFIRIKGKMPFC